MTTPAAPQVQSATPAKPLNKEERRKRYDELRARLGKSRLEVKGDPDRHYFWASKDDQYELARLDTLGYVIVKKGEVKEAAGLREDGTYQLGDVILMSCPMEVYEFLMLDNEERANSLVLNAKESFRQEAEKSGVATFEVAKPPRG